MLLEAERSAVFFLALNIGGFLFSLVLGMVIYREKNNKKGYFGAFARIIFNYFG